MLSQILLRIERNWIEYPASIMTWLLVLCNAIFTFVTVAEARRTRYKSDDIAMLTGLLLAIGLGFVVKV
jgi:hypothetical protein